MRIKFKQNIILLIMIILCSSMAYAQCGPGAFLDAFTNTCKCKWYTNPDGSCSTEDPANVEYNYEQPSCGVNEELVTYVEGLTEITECVCIYGYEWDGSSCVPEGSTQIECGPNEYYDDYSGNCITEYETPPEDPEDICGINEHKDSDGYCVCNPGFQHYDSVTGCEPIYCGDNAYYDLDEEECFCLDGFGINLAGNCVPYEEVIEEQNKKLKQQKNKQDPFEDEFKNDKPQRIDSEEELKDYSKYHSIGRIQEKNGVLGKNSISLKKARRISEDAFSPEAKRIQDSTQVLEKIQLKDESPDDPNIDNVIKLLQAGNEAQKQTAKKLKEQKDKIDTATKKGKTFLKNIKKILEYSKKMGIPEKKLKQFEQMKGNIENMLGKVDKFSGKLGAANNKLDTLNNLLDGDLGTYAGFAETQLKNYNGVYKGLTKKWLGRVNGIKAVNEHFEKIKKGDFEGMITDFNKVIDNKNLPQGLQTTAKRMKLFTQKISQAKKLGMAIKATEILAYYKDVDEVQRTLRGGAGKTAAGVLGFTRLVDNLANKISIPMLKDAIKMVNNAPKKMVKFAVDYQVHKMNRIDDAEVGRDVSRESAISVFLEKNAKKDISYIGKGNKKDQSIIYTVSYKVQDPNSKKKITKKIHYKQNAIKFVTRKGDKEEFIYPVSVDGANELVGDIIYKVKDEPMWKVFSCNKMQIYSAKKPHAYLGEGCI